MAVPKSFVSMHMAMCLCQHLRLGMMAMMIIMAVPVSILHKFVPVFVSMVFGEVQVNAGKHQPCRHEKIDCDAVVEKDDRKQRTNKGSN